MWPRGRWDVGRGQEVGLGADGDEFSQGGLRGAEVRGGRGAGRGALVDLEAPRPDVEALDGPQRVEHVAQILELALPRLADLAVDVREVVAVDRRRAARDRAAGPLRAVVRVARDAVAGEDAQRPVREEAVSAARWTSDRLSVAYKCTIHRRAQARGRNRSGRPRKG